MVTITSSKGPTDSFWYVETDSELRSLCERVQDARTLAVDTEFERQRTFYPKLCLVQLAIDDVVVCIDTRVVRELSNLVAALNRSHVPKIIHSARQDLEVLGLVCGAIPRPLYDTQVAAGLVGFSEQIGYGNLVDAVLGIKLEKSETRSDWSARPLLPNQLSYAADDVRYLAPLKKALDQRLAKLGRDDWLVEDCARLAKSSGDDYGIDGAWQRVKGIGCLSPAAFKRCVSLASWREQTARAQNVPRNWIVKDRHLIEIAALGPTSKRELECISDSEAGALRKHGESLIHACSRLPESEDLQPISRAQLTEEEKRLVKELGKTVRNTAAVLNIAAPLLMTRKEIEQTVRGQIPERLQEGWRREVVGSEIIAACAFSVGA